MIVCGTKVAGIYAEDFDKRISSILEEITNAGHPLMTVSMENNYELATQYILWQIATAGAGILMEIDPFDQPNVESAKILTKFLRLTKVNFLRRNSQCTIKKWFQLAHLKEETLL